ncbi:MAG: MFS transporter [Ardenticatenaceae bacterium]|nr:MFS transporter [Ardenticatenaceae bacterium]
MTTLFTLSHRFQRIPRNIYRYLFVMAALGFTIDGGIYSVLLNLYVLRLGYGPEFIGTLNSVGLFVFAALSLPLGAVRRFSSHQMLIIGLSCIFTGMMGLPLGQWLPEAFHSGWLVATRILTHIGLAFFFVHTAPFVMSITKGEWHSRALSLQSATLALAGFMGGLVGGVLPGLLGDWLHLPTSDPTPYQYPLLLAGIFLAPALLILTRLTAVSTPEPPAAEADEMLLPQPSKQRVLPFTVTQVVLLIIAVRILQITVVGVINTFANVYLDDGLKVSTDLIGVLTAVSRLVGVPIALSVPYLVSRWGNYRLVIWTTLFTVALMIPMAFIPHWAVAGAATIGIGSISSLRYLSFLVFSLSLVPEEKRALISGAGEMSIGLGFAFVSFVGGYLITWYGYPALFLFGAVLTLAGTVLFWLFFRKVK